MDAPDHILRQYQSIRERQKATRFLLVLNDDFLNFRTQILAMEPPPPLGRIYQLAVQEESQRSAAQDIGRADALILAARGGGRRRRTSELEEERSRRTKGENPSRGGREETFGQMDSDNFISFSHAPGAHGWTSSAEHYYFDNSIPFSSSPGAHGWTSSVGPSFRSSSASPNGGISDWIGPKAIGPRDGPTGSHDGPVQTQTHSGPRFNNGQLVEPRINSSLGHGPPTWTNNSGKIKGKMFCTFCKRPYHTIDTYWKLHGRPGRRGKRSHDV